MDASTPLNDDASFVFFQDVLEPCSRRVPNEFMPKSADGDRVRMSAFLKGMYLLSQQGFPFPDSKHRGGIIGIIKLPRLEPAGLWSRMQTANS